jgi:hypothetical protein
MILSDVEFESESPWPVRQREVVAEWRKDLICRGKSAGWGSRGPLSGRLIKTLAARNENC